MWCCAWQNEPNQWDRVSQNENHFLLYCVIHDAFTTRQHFVMHYYALSWFATDTNDQHDTFWMMRWHMIRVRQTKSLKWNKLKQQDQPSEAHVFCLKVKTTHLVVRMLQFPSSPKNINRFIHLCIPVEHDRKWKI